MKLITHKLAIDIIFVFMIIVLFIIMGSKAFCDSSTPYVKLERSFMNCVHDASVTHSSKIIIRYGFEIRTEDPIQYWYINEFYIGDKIYVWEGKLNKRTGTITAIKREKYSDQNDLRIITDGN